MKGWQRGKGSILGLSGQQRIETAQRPTAGDNEAAIIGTQLQLAASINGGRPGAGLGGGEGFLMAKGGSVFRVFLKNFCGGKTCVPPPPHEGVVLHLVG